MTDTALKERRPREYRKSGLFTLRRQLIDLGSRAIDGRSSVGAALRRSKAELIQDLGRKDSISTQQETLIELAARSKIMRDSVDSWILAQPTLINSRKKTMLSVVQQRQTIADGLTRIMKDLGLERRAKEVTLNDYIERQYGEKKCMPIKPLKKALQAFRSRKRTEMLDPSILGSVHAVESHSRQDQRSRVAIRSALSRSRLEVWLIARSGSAVIRVSSRHLSCAELLHCS